MTPLDALTRSYERFRTSVVRAAEDVVRDPHEASDVASEAYLALLERGPDDEAVHLSWLRTTARNRAINRLRRSKRHVPLGEHDALVSDREPIAGVRELVSAALERLPDRDREALVGRIVHEETYEELARRLDISTEQAHLIVHRAGVRLRREVVRGLAQAHNAPDTCTRALIRRFTDNRPTTVHDGCASCAVVSEEVDALRVTASNLALAPVAVAGPGIGLVAKLGDLLHRARAVVDRPRATGIAAALALTVSLGSAPMSPPSDAQAPGAPNLHAAAPASLLGGGALDAMGDGLAGNGNRVLAAAATPERIVRSAADPEGDGADRVAGVAVRNNVLRVPDPLGGGRNDLDARTFEVRTLSSASPGIGFVLRTVDEPLARGGRFTVAWRFESQPECSSLLTVTRVAGADPTGRLTTRCSLSMLSPSEEEIAVPASLIEGERLAVRIPFSSLGAQGRALHHHGARLIAIVADTYSSSSAVPLLSADRVPNEGTLSYTIG